MNHQLERLSELKGLWLTQLLKRKVVRRLPLKELQRICKIPQQTLVARTTGRLSQTHPRQRIEKVMPINSCALALRLIAGTWRVQELLRQRAQRKQQT
ncbi:MAG TPA: hypothetical protein VF614_06010 [Chthoniobacteraceae bacterium]